MSGHYHDRGVGYIRLAEVDVFTDALSQDAAETIHSAERLIVSSISIWEIGQKAKRGHLDLTISLDEYLARLRSIPQLEIVSVSVDDWLGNLALDWSHRDPADRTIVAVAKNIKARLVTSDRTIRAFHEKAVW